MIGLGDLRLADWFRLDRHAIECVHDPLVLEPVLYQLEVLVAAERQVVDRVREVERVALDHQTHQDLLEGVRRDVEVAWHAIDLKVALKLATLLSVDLLFHTVHQVHAVVHLVKGRCLRYYLPVLRDLLFEKGAADVYHVCAHHVLHVKTQDVAGHLWEHDIYINV